MSTLPGLTSASFTEVCPPKRLWFYLIHGDVKFLTGSISTHIWGYNIPVVEATLHYGALLRPAKRGFARFLSILRPTALFVLHWLAGFGICFSTPHQFYEKCYGGALLSVGPVRPLRRRRFLCLFNFQTFLT